MSNEKILGTIYTDAEGLYLNRQIPIRITDIEISYLDDDTLVSSTFGELRVYFDEETCELLGGEMVYTDKGWMEGFRAFLKQHGFSDRAVEDVYYSEAGMQGTYYISLDISDSFIVECDSFMNFVDGNHPKTIPITVTAFE